MTATDDSAIDRLDRRIVPPIFLSFFFYSLASWQSFPEAADFDVAMEAILAEEMQNLKRMSRLQVPLASH